MAGRERTPVAGKEGLFAGGGGVVPTPTAAPGLEDQTQELWKRLVEEYQGRDFVSMTTFVTPETKATLAVVQPLALNITGSKRYTESAILRVLAELVQELEINWAKELVSAPEGDPRETIGWVLRRHLPRLAQEE